MQLTKAYRAIAVIVPIVIVLVLLVAFQDRLFEDTPEKKPFEDQSGSCSAYYNGIPLTMHILGLSRMRADAVIDNTVITSLYVGKDAYYWVHGQSQGIKFNYADAWNLPSAEKTKFPGFFTPLDLRDAINQSCDKTIIVPVEIFSLPENVTFIPYSSSS